jgi:hypothetical protein
MQLTWDEHEEAVIKAIEVYEGLWPKELTSGVMFYYGQRIERKEFERYVRLLEGQP